MTNLFNQIKRLQREALDGREQRSPEKRGPARTEAGSARTKAALLGAWGEQEAERYLEQEKRFRVLARNWRNPEDRRQELDLVCWDGELLVFVEVKTRGAAGLVRGWMAVNYRKCCVLREAARAYLAGFPQGLRPRAYRFDVVDIELGAPGAEARITHIENYPVFRSRF